uniref:non-specific serine/threonine protein kinase n=1 Tax=Ciona savignyi TaxID=51511 RepID=H2Z6J2_CIOSA
IPQEVLLGSLLEHICQLYEADSKKAKQLFHIICKKLQKMKVMSPIAYLDEYASVRIQYKTSFYNLIHSSLFTVQATGQLMEYGNLKVNRKDVFDFGVSRYKEEYDEIEVIGYGAFGKVYKAINKIDGQVYAVKQIKCKSNGSEIMPETNKMLREVQSLASMQHENIIRYHCAWIEHTPVSEIEQTVPLRVSINTTPYSTNDTGSFGDYDPVEHEDGKFWQPSSDSSDEDSSCSEEKSSSNTGSLTTDVIFTHGVMKRSTIRRVQSYIITGVSNAHLSSLSHIESNTRSHSVSSMQDIAILKRPEESQDEAPCYKPSIHVVMYIQMQLCNTTLKKWLVQRNQILTTKPDLSHVPASFCIFKQIIAALNYIHKKGMLHRDIKPQNIFINDEDQEPQIKLGDFGLARAKLSTSSSEPLTPIHEMPVDFLSDEHTSGVGTSLYASPEQLKGETYDDKADIYSAGIVLYELICPLGTTHERTVAINILRKQEIPTDFQRNAPSAVGLLKSILSHEYQTRPSAEQLLLSLDAIPEATVDLKKQNELLRLENTKLKKMVKLYENELVKN